jgi:hypothetical protein
MRAGADAPMSTSPKFPFTHLEAMIVQDYAKSSQQREELSLLWKMAILYHQQRMSRSPRTITIEEAERRVSKLRRWKPDQSQVSDLTFAREHELQFRWSMVLFLMMSFNVLGQSRSWVSGAALFLVFFAFAGLCYWQARKFAAVRLLFELRAPQNLSDLRPIHLGAASTTGR